MALSGTFNFDPSLGEFVIYAFNMCGIRATALVQEHMVSARMAANLILAEWSGKTPNLWQVDLQTINLVVGQPTYDLPANTITVLDAYVTVGSGEEQFNRIILPVGRSEYAAYPNPNQVGAVTTYWFNRLLAPTLNVYYAPDGTYPTLSYYRVRQSMDAALGSAQQVELPYYWFMAFAKRLAAELAISWAPERAVALKASADEAYLIAYDQNTETGDFYVTPMISGYYRR